MSYASTFRELKVYMLAIKNAQVLFERTKEFPAVERYALTDQIRRSSRAVCAMIGEAWAHRPYPKAFRSKLIQALGECFETRVWLDFALSAEYISDEEFSEFDSAFEQISAMLYRMQDRPDLFSRRRNNDSPEQ